MASFGELLAELRLDSKMTQRELAHILHGIYWYNIKL